MLGALEETVDGCDIAVEAGELVAAIAVLDRLTAKVSAAVGAFDEAELYELAGSTSARMWLVDHAGMAADAAHHLVRNARRLRQLPVTRDAWETGGLSGGKVEAVLRNVRVRHTGLFADHEAAVVPAVAPLSVLDTVAVMQQWREMADALDPPPPRDERPDELFHTGVLDGRSELRGSLSPTPPPSSPPPCGSPP